LQDINGADVTGLHAAKTVGRILPRVQFRTGSVTDSAAWLVEDPESWVHAINGDKIPIDHRSQSRDETDRDCSQRWLSYRLGYGFCR